MITVNNSQVLQTILILFIIVLVCPFTYGNVIYVDNDAVGANDGSSWADAYWCLQDALFNAHAGDEIRVAYGTYKPDRRVAVSRSRRQITASGDRTASFQLKNGVTIKGGYAGFCEPDLDARDLH